ncbi:T9SS type A sorting domain-containing protein [bacterium]|nr:T9SS type A sorting domain-containing protein [bacterium]
MKSVLFTLGLSLLSTLGMSQDYWNYYNSDDGLIQDSINRLVIENSQSIYLGTNAGLSHFNQGTFTSYTTANSGLNTNKILDMELGNNLLFLHTDSGISVFDGLTFTNYTARNGLPSNEVKEIQVTSNGTLWIGTTTGVASFDGTQFTQYPNKIAYSLGIDSADQVYIITKSFVFGKDTTNNLEIFDGITWNSYKIYDADSTAIIFQSKFKLLNNGQLIIRCYSPNPFYFVQQNVITKLPFQINHSQREPKNADQFQTDQSGKYWVGYQTEGNYYASIYSGSLSDLKRHYFNHTIENITSVETADNTIAFGTDNGFYFASINVGIAQAVNDFDVNTINTQISSKGPVFNNSLLGVASFEFPKGNVTHGIYAANFIVSAKKATSTTFDAHPIVPWEQDYFIGPKSNKREATRSFMAKVSKTEILTHIAQSNNSGYQMPDGILNWPAIGDSSLNEPFDLAPFVDVNSNGCYDPANGDYPVIKGDEAIYWINRPNDSSALSDLEYHNMLYGFNDPNDPLINQNVFLERTIVNRANVAYDSIKVGFWIDIDLGYVGDDYMGCDSINNIMYGYNGDSHDENAGGQSGFGLNPPAIGVKFLSDSMDNFVFNTTGSADNGDMRNSSDVHNYLNARWKNGQHITYGGNGFRGPGVTTIPTNYMFTGDPVANTGWSEISIGNSIGDRRGLAAIPYFSLQPNERKTIVLAIGYGYDSVSTDPSHLNAVPAMINSLNHAKTVYDNMQIQTGTTASNFACPVIRIGVKEEGVSNSDINIYPVPSNGMITVSSDEPMKNLQVIDVSGSIIMEADLTSKGLAPSFQFPNSIEDGFYFLRIQRQDNSWETKKIIIAK